MRRFLCTLWTLAGWPALVAAQGFSDWSAWQTPLYDPAPAYATGGYAAPYGGVSYSNDRPLVAPAPGAYPQGYPAGAPADAAAYGYQQTISQPPVAGGPCHGACSPNCAEPCCGRCLHRSGAFAEAIYWRPSGVDLAYAVPQDGIGLVGTVQLGDVGVLAHDYEPGFRTGLNLALDCNSSLMLTYTEFEANTSDDLFVNAPLVVQPLVMFPGTFNAGFTAQVAAANSSLQLQTIDLDYRGVVFSGPRYYVNYLAGARYGALDQNFTAVFPFAPPDGTTFVDTQLDFEGAGVRFGLEGDRLLLPRLGISAYTKVVGTLLGGEVSGNYRQTNQLNGVEAITSWEDARVVPVVEAEVGFRWANRKDTLWLSAGYSFAAWSNMVTTQEWINGVQALNFTGISRDSYDAIRFDGLTARVELRL